ncbi:MAG TPA: glycosyltransferase family 4 protein [Rhizomicrobium sp.]|nr:glycosyltransferase family 4 protein [Rhizomicrobium sp.]
MIPRVAILACLSANGEQGGAERFFTGLRDALSGAGIAAQLLEIYNDERDFEHIKKSYLRFYDLKLDGYDGIISAKAPSFVARHGNHVCYLMHTMRVFYDMFDSTFRHPTRQNLEQRRLVHALDTAALQRPRRLFAIGDEVAERLIRFNGLRAEVMRHPTSMVGLHEGGYEYFLLPGRLHRWKRTALAIEGMQFVTAPVELIVVGEGEDEAEFRRAACGNPRIHFLGRVSDARLADLYADALAVLFTPKSEDLGLITLEAFQSAKPVITCTDSGEPARIVTDGVSGFVCRPEAAHIGACMEHLAHNPDHARAMGRAGQSSIAEITWERVADTLRTALGFDEWSIAQ